MLQLDGNSFMAAKVYINHFYANGYLYFVDESNPSSGYQIYDLKTRDIHFGTIEVILDYVEEHRNDEEEIHLDPGWSLLRYQTAKRAVISIEDLRFFSEKGPLCFFIY